MESPVAMTKRPTIARMSGRRGVGGLDALDYYHAGLCGLQMDFLDFRVFRGGEPCFRLIDAVEFHNNDALGRPVAA